MKLFQPHYLKTCLLVLCVGVFVLVPQSGAMEDGRLIRAQMVFDQLEKIEDRLDLSPAQQPLWESASRKTQEIRAQIRENIRDTIAWSEAELGRHDPNLAEMSRRMGDMQQRNQVLRQDLNAAWLQLYDNLSPSQKLLVRDALKKQIGRLKMFQQLRERLGYG